MRLPWSTKSGEYRHLYPVVDGAVRRDKSIPQREIIERVLSNYWKGGAPSTEPFAYTLDSLAERHRTEAETGPLSQSRVAQSFIESTFFPSVRSGLIPSKELAVKQAVFKIFDLQTVPQNGNWLLTYLR